VVYGSILPNPCFGLPRSALNYRVVESISFFSVVGMNIGRE